VEGLKRKMNAKRDENFPSKKEKNQKVMENYLKDVMNLLIHGRFK